MIALVAQCCPSKNWNQGKAEWCNSQLLEDVAHLRIGIKAKLRTIAPNPFCDVAHLRIGIKAKPTTITVSRHNHVAHLRIGIKAKRDGRNITIPRDVAHLRIGIKAKLAEMLALKVLTIKADYRAI